MSPTPNSQRYCKSRDLSSIRSIGRINHDLDVNDEDSLLKPFTLRYNLKRTEDLLNLGEKKAISGATGGGKRTK